ncbi:MAG: hypothetical protein J7K36_02390, partial [Archaeoglobaceae archaeon]|nr:hypothetical protein [Archaeoglobaceae archaeon]
MAMEKINWRELLKIGGAIGFAIGTTMLPRRATGVPPTPPEPTPPEPTPPTPTENPVKNPSFEQGLDYWEQVRYAPHPTRVDNSPEHLIEVSKEYVTHGRYSLHLRAW